MLVHRPIPEEGRAQGAECKTEKGTEILAGLGKRYAFQVLHPQGWSPINSPCLSLSFQIPKLTIWMLCDGQGNHEQQEEKLGFKVLHPLGECRLSSY